MARRLGPADTWRLCLMRPDRAARYVTLGETVQTLRGARQKANEYAADVGLLGTIAVEEKVGAEYVKRGTAHVKNSEVERWVPA